MFAMNAIDMTKKVIWSTPLPVMISFLVDGALAKKYTSWQKLYLEIHDTAHIYCVKEKGSDGLKKDEHIYDASHVNLVKIAVLDNTSGNSSNGVGIKVSCKDNNLETSFRILLSTTDTECFCSALSLVSRRHNIPFFQNSNISHSSSEVIQTKKDVYAISPYRFSFIRTNVVKNIDKVEQKNIFNEIRRRRGSFHWLPVAFSNDLVHGSWWFVLGSVLTFVVADLTLYNAYKNVIGEDDSNLTREGYRVAWALVVASGFFCVVGSLAFVRAMSDPPMKPLFKWYHFSSDELFGSWMFLLAMLPAVPYSLIYLAELHEFIYFVILMVSVVGVLATLLFVLACYPSDKEKNYSRMLPTLLCCTCNSTFIKKHCATDWLIATWLIFWSTLLATIVLFFYSIVAFFQGSNEITNFINVTTLFECFLFLVGSAYFVAGSYPSNPHAHQQTHQLNNPICEPLFINERSDTMEI